MVWFQCEGCGETLKKPKVRTHSRQCPGGGGPYSCIDCLTVFDLRGVQGHTSCVTEAQKYAEGATKPGGFAAGGVPGSSRGGGAAAPVGLEFCRTQPPYRCDLCGVSCTSYENLLAHASSKKHRNRTKAKQGAAAGPTPKPGGGEASGNGDGATTPAAAKGKQGKQGAAAGAVDWARVSAKILKKKGARMALKKLFKKAAKKAGVGRAAAEHRAAWEKAIRGSPKIAVDGDEAGLARA